MAAAIFLVKGLELWARFIQKASSTITFACTIKAVNGCSWFPLWLRKRFVYMNVGIRRRCSLRMCFYQ